MTVAAALNAYLIFSFQAEGEDKMRQNGQGGVSPPLPAPAVPVNMGVYEFKHPDSDTERPADHVF